MSAGGSVLWLIALAAFMWAIILEEFGILMLAIKHIGQLKSEWDSVADHTSGKVAL